MARGHTQHDHGAGDERRLGLAALLTGGFMLAELAGGLISGSLALLADAGHMLTDFASLALAWGAARLAPGADAEAARRALRQRLDRQHGIGHATIEIEPAETEQRT